MIKFRQFEQIKKAVDEGMSFEECGPLMESENINEGLFSNIVNYFSKIMGGKISKIDKLIDKYRTNEHDYWGKWADANFKYNEADALMKETTNPAERAKYTEMKERADKLLKVIDSTRDEVNDALSRQAKHVVKSNARLQDYYLMVKAKADEEVANEKYDKLKKLSDKDTVETLYKKVEVDSERARKKETEFKQKYGGQVSTSVDTPKAKPVDSKEVPFKEFGISDLGDFIVSDDKPFYSKVSEMPKANMKTLVTYMKNEMTAQETAVSKEIKGYENELKKLDPADTAVHDKKSKLEIGVKRAREQADETLKMLKDRINKIENKMLVG